MAFSVIIPARFQSQRLPGKVLMDILGKTMIQRVYEQACQSSASQVIVATDDERVASIVKSFGGKVCMTASDHESGTDRLQEVVVREGLDDDAIVVNVQGDEPLIPPAVIDQVARNLALQSHDYCSNDMPGVSTLYEETTDLQQIMDTNVVKVVTDENNRALYFSRSPIPWARNEFSTSPVTLPDGVIYKRHVGIYGYRVELLNRFVGWKPAPLEVLEKLEQLRMLWHGEAIHIEVACESMPPGVDTQRDLYYIRLLLANA